MKLTLTKEALTHALDRASRVVERRNTVPVLANVLLRTDGEHLCVTATDLDSVITTRAQAKIEHAGETTVHAHTLSDFVKKLPASQVVTLEQPAGEPRVILRAGRTRLNLPTISPAEFPVFDVGDPQSAFQLPASRLATAIERVSFAISTEETRYYLNGIYLDPVETEDGPALTAVATDGHRLGLQKMLAPEGAQYLKPIIIPRKAVDTITKILKPLDDEPAGLAISAHLLTLTAGSTVYSTKLIDGTYPDYTRVIPSGGDQKATLTAAALSAAVDRVITVAGERSKAVKFSFGEPTRETLTLTVTNPDSGDATDTVDIAYEGEPMQIGFNGRYVLDILGALQAESLLITLSDAGSPALITPVGRDDTRAVLMPMRV
ncbi:DNA polymerase III subunit beta [Paracoccus sp. (in: a-proteobacteria)]|uniref:DNA polymerase III subunit beta n=1 Tax=Paracoccus sp. TaxID=267 RepID=UPI002AFDDCA3|nr:DNA polymerase III subunit beta [Paracoccus sp. (in: a-proteobacteria)]